jgi:tetratricopeptide (TPR) repeat protein
MPGLFTRALRWTLFFVVAATWTASCTMLCSAEQTGNASAAPVALATEWFPKSWKDGYVWQPLLRELPRQALLIAARDELSLPTRDQTLGEKLSGDNLLHLEVRAFANGKCTLRIASLSSEKAASPTIASGKEKWKSELKYSPDGNAYVTLIPQLEKLSRGEFVTTLRDLGYRESKSTRNTPDGDIELLLKNMDFVSQFAAVRQAHCAIKRGDESTDQIGTLVRGYANLSLLTDHYWSSMSDVFAARALLYAERMVALSKNSRAARWHRAYARALAGLHGAALEDLNALCENKPTDTPPVSADKSPDVAEKPKVESDHLPADAPPWAPLLIQYCRYDHKRLVELKTVPEVQQLASLLAFDIQSAYDRRDWLAEAGKETAEKCPEAYYVVDALARDGQMFDSRSAATAAMESFANLMPNRIIESDLLPADTVAQLGALLDEKIADQLEDDAQASSVKKIGSMLHELAAKSEGEPSLATLAQLIDEEQFVEIANYLKVSSNAVEYSKQPLVDHFYPLVADHRYANYIKSFTLEKQQQPSDLATYSDGIVVVDPRPCMQPMFVRFWWTLDKSKNQWGRGKSWRAFSDADCTSRRLADVQQMTGDVWWKQISRAQQQAFAYVFEQTSPFSPVALSLTIEASSNPSDQQLGKWEEKAAGNPAALYRLGKRYRDRRDFKAAIRVYEKSYELSKTVPVIEALADSFQLNDQDELWVPTMERLLKEQDGGLMHAQIHQKIAEYLMARDKWADAKPHALAAAGTYSGWGLELASNVCEGLGEWEESEEWIRKATESYPTNQGHKWYQWCVRTGRGDRAKAKEYYDDFLKQDMVRNARGGEASLTEDDLMHDRPAAALARIKASPILQKDDVWQMQSLVLSIELGPRAESDKLFKSACDQVEAQWAKTSPDWVRLYKLMRDVYSEDQAAEKKLADIKQILSQADPEARCNFSYFTAEILAAKGKKDLAVPFWTDAATRGPFDHYTATLAGHRLAGVRVDAKSVKADPAK